MRIFLMAATAGRYGGVLNNSLHFLDRYINSEIQKQEFKSSFQQFWITIYYPPLYVLPGVAGIEKKFMVFYETLPKLTLKRKSGKIDIQLQGPEFSECFDKAARINYNDVFEIDDRYKNFSDVELAKLLIDKYILAGEIVNSKLKPEDDFNFLQFRSILENIRTEVSDEFLKNMVAFQARDMQVQAKKSALASRGKRMAVNKPKDKLIRDLRIYSITLPVKALYPYAYRYSEIFLNLLVRKGLKCPTYDHIYIQVAGDYEKALTHCFSAEGWHAYGMAVIDYKAYEQGNEKEKEQLVFKAICDGLRDIASLDTLDSSVIEETIAEIEKHGLATELTFKEMENAKYKLKITYTSESMEDECPVYFELTDKTTGRSKKTLIGRAEHSQLHLWLQKIALTTKSVKIKASDSIRGDVWLKDKAREMEYTISELLA